MVELEHGSILIKMFNLNLRILSDIKSMTSFSTCLIQNGSKSFLDLFSCLPLELRCTANYFANLNSGLPNTIELVYPFPFLDMPFVFSIRLHFFPWFYICYFIHYLSMEKTQMFID